MDSIPKSEIETKVLEVIAPLLDAQGFRIVDLDCRFGGRGFVRIFIERNDEKASPPTLDECAQLSPLLGDALDANEAFSGSYDLEISSPGLDRRLRMRQDFERAVGEEVKLKLFERLENRGANFTGVLEKVEPGQVVLKVGKESIPIPLSKMKQANVVWKMKPSA